MCKLIKWLTLSGILLSSGLAFATPSRIIALSPHIVEMLYAIGAGEQIVGVTDYANYPEQAKEIPRVGGFYGIQLEKIIELDPDLIISWKGGNNQAELNQLTKLGYSVYNSGAETLTDISLELKKLGELTQHVAAANQVITSYQAELEKLIQSYKDKPKVTVFFQLWSKPLMTVSKTSWVQQAINVCNGENVFADIKGAYPQVNLENVLLAAPQVIIKTDEQPPAAQQDWSKWQMIPAVANNHIFSVNADTLYRASPRVLIGIKAVCNALDSVRDRNT